MGVRMSVVLFHPYAQNNVIVYQTPLEILGSACELWVRSDLGVTSGGLGVTSWADQSGNSRDFLNASDSTDHPIVVAGGAPSGADLIRFDYTNSQYLRTAETALAQPYHVFVCAKRRVAGTTAEIFFDSAATNNVRMLVSTASNVTSIYAGTGDVGTNTWTVNDWHVVDGLFNGASSRCALDNTGAETGNAGTDAPTGFTIGRSVNNTFPASFDFTEIVVVNRAAIANEITKLVATMSNYAGI